MLAVAAIPSCNQKSLELPREFLYTSCAFRKGSPDCAQVAQAVERSPEKAGVGGSTPSLGTIETPLQKASALHKSGEEEKGRKDLPPSVLFLFSNGVNLKTDQRIDEMQFSAENYYGVGFFVLSDLVLVLHGKTDIIEAVEQAMTAKFFHFKAENQSVIRTDSIFL